MGNQLVVANFDNLAVTWLVFMWSFMISNGWFAPDQLFEEFSILVTSFSLLFGKYQKFQSSKPSIFSVNLHMHACHLFFSGSLADDKVPLFFANLFCLTEDQLLVDIYSFKKINIGRYFYLH